MWDDQTIRELLNQIACGQCTVDDAFSKLRALPVENLEFARIDHHRAVRQGFTEVVYCAGKTPLQSAQIIERLALKHHKILGTRATAEHFAAAKKLVPELQYHELARIIWLDRKEEKKLDGVVIVAAGTADVAVAEEAALTLQIMGHAVKRVYDVGLAGLHRLLSELPAIQSANVVIVVAGMEGALPSVVGGLVSCPVVALPTSVGYGTGMGGIAALLSMLNSCASGMSVVNIDNGFGAGCFAARVNTLAHKVQ